MANDTPKPTRTRKPRRNPLKELERLESYLSIMIKLKSEPLPDYLADNQHAIISTQASLRAYTDISLFLAEIAGERK
jgi:hypothetical protein